MSANGADDKAPRQRRRREAAAGAGDAGQSPGREHPGRLGGGPVVVRAAVCQGGPGRLGGDGGGVIGAIHRGRRGGSSAAASSEQEPLTATVTTSEPAGSVEDPMENEERTSSRREPVNFDNPEEPARQEPINLEAYAVDDERPPPHPHPPPSVSELPAATVVKTIAGVERTRFYQLLACSAVSLAAVLGVAIPLSRGNSGAAGTCGPLCGEGASVPDPDKVVLGKTCLEHDEASTARSVAALAGAGGGDGGAADPTCGSLYSPAAYGCGCPSPSVEDVAPSSVCGRLCSDGAPPPDPGPRRGRLAPPHPGRGGPRRVVGDGRAAARADVPGLGGPEPLRGRPGRVSPVQRRGEALRLPVERAPPGRVRPDLRGRRNQPDACGHRALDRGAGRGRAVRRAPLGVGLPGLGRDVRGLGRLLHLPPGMVRRRGRRGGVRRALRRRRLRVRVSRHAGAAHGGVRPALPEGPHVRTPLLGRVAGARAEPGRPRQVGHVRVVGVRGEVRGPPLHLPPVRHDGGHVRLPRQSPTGRRLVVRVRRVLRPVPRRRPGPRARRAREDLRGVALRRVVPAVARRPEGGGRPPELRHVREPRDHRARVRVRTGPPPGPTCGRICPDGGPLPDPSRVVGGRTCSDWEVLSSFDDEPGCGDRYGGISEVCGCDAGHEGAGCFEPGQLDGRIL
ncbi:hypothetical protein THAOC_08342 [Thalassiosira oceanica]|uniref:Uncharacterized protein n=1 Tax=Thalassiosira oceanica TaxID=159749 RepID=K0SZ88_THAOC|nr:hypothetical protein THAOC_08342 [Thalassiosira oceanica]|eukprot:EJK70309.1 hypothetical protein THAOC_08342 [Thalassiosira oceanica]